MIYEWRIYDVTPGKMGVLHDRFRNVTSRLFEKHGIKIIGFWEAIIGSSNTLYYMIAFENMAHKESAWNAFMNDPEWMSAKQESEKNGPLTQRVVNVLLKPTDYSPAR